MIQRSPSGRLQVAQQTPLGDFPCLGCRQITPWVTVRCPDGERRISVRPPDGFFPPITPQIPQVTERRPAGDRDAGR